MIETSLSGIEIALLADNMPPPKMDAVELKNALKQAQLAYQEANLDYITASPIDKQRLKAAADLAYTDLRMLQAAPNARQIMAEIVAETSGRK